MSKHTSIAFTEYTWIVEHWGFAEDHGLSRQEQVQLCILAEDWLSANEGDQISIVVRMPRTADELPGLYAGARAHMLTRLHAGDEDFARIDDLTDRAWEHTLQNCAHLFG